MRHLVLVLVLLPLAACGAEAPTAGPAGATADAVPPNDAKPAADDAKPAADDAKPAAGARPKPPETRPTVTATWRGEGAALEFNAWKMGCSGCEATIQTRIGAIEGVRAVEADLATTTVRVELEDAASRTAVIEAITEALEAPESGRAFEIIRAEP